MLGFPPRRLSRGSPYFGAIVGRYANRIASGRSPSTAKDYPLAVNNGPNTCTAASGLRQGGLEGRASGTDEASRRLTYTSPDGEEGFPGTLRRA